MATNLVFVPCIKYKHRIGLRYRNLKNPAGPHGRIKILKAAVQALFKKERIELYPPTCGEVQQYAERLISEAIRHGDKHPLTMEIAEFWLEDKSLIHKLFKVLAPRYANYKTSVTADHIGPLNLLPRSTHFRHNWVLELKGNPYPPYQEPKANIAFPRNPLEKVFRQRELINSVTTKDKSVEDKAQ